MSERLILWSQEDNLILTNDEVGVLLDEIVIKFQMNIDYDYYA